MEKTRPLLLLIFLLAVFIRFLYFPQNIYFGFDQARDAFESINIYKNFDLKIIGPSTAKPGLFHGPAWWYLIGPMYVLSGGNPEIPAALILILNAIGVFLIYKISASLFNNKVGLISALLFAFSFEQTQYAMYFGNPAPAVLSLMIFYLGLILLVFKNKWYGLAMSLFGLGLSVQFEFALIYQSFVFILLILVYKKNVLKHLNLKSLILSFFAILTSFSTFIVADFLYGFKTIRTLFGFEGKADAVNLNISNFSLYFEKLGTLFAHNFFNLPMVTSLLLLFLLIAFAFKISDREEIKRVILLLVWGFSSVILFFFGKPNLYYFNIGVFVAFLIIVAFIFEKILQRSKFIFVVLISFVIFNDINLIKNNNRSGITNDIYVQEGMILSRQKELIDYIYNTSDGLPIVVSASTMPLKINTTWAYLFNWYGRQKYGTIPYWAGENADGFPGSLPRWISQEKNYAFYSIVEPKRGVGQGLIDSFLIDQEQYGKVVDQKVWGDKDYNQLVVQKRLGNKNEDK